MVYLLIKKYLALPRDDRVILFSGFITTLLFLICVPAIFWFAYNKQQIKNEYQLFRQIIETHSDDEITLTVNHQTLTIHLKNGDTYTFPSYFLLESSYTGSCSNNDSYQPKPKSKGMTVGDYMMLKFLGF